MKGYDVDGNPAVIKMASLSITGNVINLNWFKHIRMESGKPDAVAILLLADVVYWYRPIEVRDELTGDVIEMRKKFAADKLQRSYGAFAELYGFTKDQVKDALKRLEDKGLIELVFRHPVVNGQKLGNVLYIGLNVDRLKEITTPLLPLKQRGSKDESAEPLTFKDDTNTEITTETSPEITQGGGLSEKEIEQANAKVTAMIENSKKVKYENRDKIPEQYLPLCDAYVEVTGQKPTKRVLMDWLSAFSDWVGEGLQPQDIRAAHKHATRPDGGFLVGRPGSLTNTAVALKSKAQTSAPQINEGAVVATLDMIEEKYGLDKEYVPPPAWVAEHMQKIAQRKSINRKGLHR
jgi:hypothetical protein